MKSKTPLALMEQLVMVLVFALAAALCVSCFVAADRLSQRNAMEDRAVLAAQNAAETIKRCQGDYEQAAALLDGTWAEGVLAVHTEEDFSVFIVPEDSGDPLLGQARVEVFSDGDDAKLVELTVAWQEVSGHG